MDYFVFYTTGYLWEERKSCFGFNICYRSANRLRRLDISIWFMVYPKSYWYQFTVRTVFDVLSCFATLRTQKYFEVVCRNRNCILCSICSGGCTCSKICTGNYIQRIRTVVCPNFGFKFSPHILIQTIKLWSHVWHIESLSIHLICSQAVGWWKLMSAVIRTSVGF